MLQILKNLLLLFFKIFQLQLKPLQLLHLLQLTDLLTAYIQFQHLHLFRKHFIFLLSAKEFFMPFLKCCLSLIKCFLSRLEFLLH
jgi:hypothetical protein